ncbi:hypothetical protein GGR03_003157 [Aurantimonas endophytica]|uniref:Transcriptional regulator n=2 Tax=Aurantimonas endophytica TaxID=1522175 RepID=A0A7W6MQL1_9HYPH|nr:transcriptional regulator [Aurantimonas endophytica]MBB4004069.1 hypothetical protein [Aurantimonas endophytica]MCO6404915.1 transcriptional regulator [Aurantimonas endophytica]
MALLAALLLACVPMPSGPAAAAELLMLERPGCVWCERFNAEIAPAYPATAAGRIAPLRRIDLTEPWPHDLTDVAKERVTPTFVLVEDGQEIARMRGYPGDAFFWGLLDDMLAKLPGGADALAEAI